MYVGLVLGGPKDAQNVLQVLRFIALMSFVLSVAATLLINVQAHQPEAPEQVLKSGEGPLEEAIKLGREDLSLRRPREK